MVTKPCILGTLLVSCLGFACENRGPRSFRDTEGRAFEATCPKDAPCEVAQKSGVRRADKPRQTLLLGGRLVGVCDTGQGADAPNTWDCRPLSCDSDANCPPLHGMKEGSCLHGRCSDPAEPLRVQDAVLLCLAGTGLGRESPAQVERYALAQNCGTPCVVPTPCLQP